MGARRPGGAGTFVRVSKCQLRRISLSVVSDQGAATICICMLFSRAARI